MRRVTTDYDAYWKEAVHSYFRDCIRLFFPSLHKLINWKHPVQFLGTELRRLRLGRGRRPDILAQVQLKNGAESLIVVHIEIQVQPDPRFEERMFDYYLHLRATYDKEIACLAILADANPNWRPKRFYRQIAEFELLFEFMTVKLLDLDPQVLEQSKNPIAVITLAHLNVLRLRNKPDLLLQEKIRMIRKLLEGGYTKRYIANLYAEVDTIMALPKELERKVVEVVREVQRKKRIRRLTSLEQIALEDGARQGLEQGFEKGLQQGLQQGLQTGIAQVLELRFGTVPNAVLEALSDVNDIDALCLLHAEALKTESLERFHQVLKGYSQPPSE